MLFKIITSIQFFFIYIKNYTYLLTDSFLFKTNFLILYFHRNDLIWQEGLLFDFLQKKITDNWVKTFLVTSAYLFSERLIFDKIIKFYLNLIIWPFHIFSIFEINNVAGIFSFIFLILILVFYFILIYFLFFLMF